MSQSFPEPTSDLPLGGRYKVISQLGAGGFGQTFLVLDLHLPGHPCCVVKKLLPQKNDSENLEMARRLFDTEAKVLYQLGIHDQIPRLLAHFEQNQEFYLAQEFIEGEPLSKELSEGQPWAEDRVIVLLQDILQVLAFVHQQQVIHRDIKPPNLIRRRQDGKIVLIDFGAVKQVSAQGVSADTGMTDMTISIGTRGFIPNEQLAGKPRFSSDVYAVGIVGIWALTGAHPKHLKEDLRTGEISWQHLAPTATPELLNILERMVRYDFRDRYPTAIEALEALRSLPDDLIKSLPPPSISTPTVSYSDRERHPLSTTWDMVDADSGLEATSLWTYPDAAATTLTLAGGTDVLAPTYYKTLEHDSSAQAPATSTAAAKGLFLRQHWRLAMLLAIGVGIVSAVVFMTRMMGLFQTNDHLLEPATTMGDSLIDLFPKQEAIELVQEAHRLREQGKVDDALTLYDKVLRLRSDLAEAYWGRCTVLYTQGKLNDAIVACNDALAIRANYPEALVGKGKAIEQQRRYLEALRLYDRAAIVNPSLAVAWSAKGVVLQKVGRSAEALVALDRAIDLDRNLAEAWSAKGAALWNLGRYNDAIASLDKALQLNPDDQDAQELREKGRVELGR